ncbi:zonular occludens toxin domain-containing protein [Clostridium perfringens]|uniref:zonular occludens toxin domain-containing protein n=1 Tax=Clostridium perfringens TaxID=1502 RepID=UPI000F538B3A|nr:zonular occludens toxin domain-containing protein [Clostridium perfringens]
MIDLYSGTPGSGKSLHVARDIFVKLNIKKECVISNFPINLNLIRKKSREKFLYLDNSELTVNALVDFAKKNHVIGKENQTLLVIDECQTFFNPREFARKDRLEWNNFFSQHRKLGFSVILVTQNDRLIDRQIRALIEYETKHRKVNNFKVGKLLPIPTFACVTYWYGVREKLDVSFFFMRKKYSNLYDSYKMFEGTV